MKLLEYGDEEIGRKELLFTVSASLLGIRILSLPHYLAEKTAGITGWLPILLAGLLMAAAAWTAAKLASRFPKQTFFEFAAKLITRPGAVVLSLVFGVYFVLFVAMEVRAVGMIAKHYLFDRTPIEAVSLVFILSVIYAVAGTTSAILRLNLMFMPIILLILGLVMLMNINFIEWRNLTPALTTDWTELGTALWRTLPAFLGFEVLLFYTALMNKPGEAPGAAALGVGIPLLLYMVSYITAIGVFSQSAAATMLYPVVEIAKEVEVPGEFFERFESIFFTVWTMAIFNTTAMVFDTAIKSFQPVFSGLSKQVCIYVLSPLIFLIAMLPQNTTEFFHFVNWTGYFGLALMATVPASLLVLAVQRTRREGGGREG